eukprot:CAMPEP_0176141694 /NCGR_PEP_ID=MMETSP0120_2-20121206/72057_1 /TAXON_ID=160619 /ORGANISM="Kryptoperidinium foliaceum, Strain CCMP 1326" /LENGTH=430 /DNA_ID=CAMNT_0017477847 /DNA_START=465 /DNA_END=1757 /DNA_ORIENTATION=-
MTNQTSNNNKNKSAAAVSPTATKSSFLLSECTDVPIFLKKTYHMIDTCDPNVACWSDEGDTFVVKDPVKFEKQIIPQFFKHSKFSSFVRQLNFYAFRKIKYADTIRIDPKLEAETANYWRFRHEKFQRGHPELLTEIKRMNGQKQAAAPKKTQAGSGGASQAQAVIPVAMQQENNALKSEVSNLKQRIDAMTKNIDELTSMVQKVTLATKVPEEDAVKSSNTNKRSKVQDPVEDEQQILTPDESRSSNAPQAILDSPDLAPSNAMAMELDALPLPPSIPSPLPVEDRPDVSSGTELSDEGFVDQLFTAFKTEDLLEMPTDNVPKDNRPRPELMNRLSDALSALPRDIQELIVERLIQAITSPKEEMTTSSLTTPDQDPKHIANLQLAAATLATLLNQCGGQSQQSHSKALFSCSARKYCFRGSTLQLGLK